MDDLRAEFIAETRETMEALAEQLLLWEKDPSDNCLIDSVFRFVHTVKGSCGFLDLPRMEKLSHVAEELLSEARDKKLEVSANIVGAIIAVIDRIAALNDALETGLPVPDDDATLIDAVLQSRMNGAILNPVVIPVPIIEPTHSSNKSEVLGSSYRTVRVPLAHLDQLMNSVSDLVLARNEVGRYRRSAGLSQDEDHAFAQLSSTVAEIRDAVGLMRMQHMDRLFSSLPRLLRDICVDLDKKISFSVDGGEVEIDREMVELLRDPLTHIVRNAADHGIESPEERIAAGKNPTGKITIIARQSGNQIILEIFDDGRGINVQKLGERAIARNLITANQWQNMTEDERLALVFAPGLTTAEAVTSISGRGVGMDVVRTNLNAVGATIDLKNVEGKGLSIALNLPLTLSIIAGLTVSAGNQNFGLTRSSVIEMIAVSNAHVQFMSVGGVRIASVRGRYFYHANIESVLDIPVSADAGNARVLVLLKPARGEPFALEVDAVVDTEELVVKPCSAHIMSTGMYAGITLPDNGRPMLLLDASGIAAAIGAIKAVNIPRVSDDDSSDATSAPTGEPVTVLVFDNQQGEPKSIRLALVERIEEVEHCHIHRVGSQYCVSRDSQVFDLIDYEVGGTTDKLKVLRLTDGHCVCYAAVSEVRGIYDTHCERMDFMDSVESEGIVQIDGSPVQLVNGLQYFSDKTAMLKSGILCFIDSGAGSVWERNILSPLLKACGYSVSFSELDRDGADLVFTCADTGSTDTDRRTIRLRSGSAAIGTNDDKAIYRYDKVQILSAIDERLLQRGLV